MLAPPLFKLKHKIYEIYWIKQVLECTFIYLKCFGDKWNLIEM